MEPEKETTRAAKRRWITEEKKGVEGGISQSQPQRVWGEKMGKRDLPKPGHEKGLSSMREGAGQLVS